MRGWKMNVILGLVLFVLASASNANENLEEQVKRLIAANKALVERVAALEKIALESASEAKGERSIASKTEEEIAPEVFSSTNAVNKDSSLKRSRSRRFVGVNHEYSYAMLDPTTNINRKQELLLKRKQAGEISSNSVILGGAVTAIANAQRSDTDSKFGYLMRHPTSANQIGKNAQEAVLHSVQLNLTALMGDWVSAYAEILYDPEQSFGAGTITALGRNQLQLRRGYVLIGDLERAPVYAAVGKMATPFGLTDTVNPFTGSTVWHAFGGLSYGARVGYIGDNLSISLMAAQGGSQFRATQTSVRGTSVPSKLNNVVADLKYSFDLPSGNDDSLVLGGSYVRGTNYCQDFPIFHFTPCDNDNGAYALYGQVNWGDWLVQGEFAKTLREWPGTMNPNPPLDIYSASKVTSFGFGARRNFYLMNIPSFVSAEFSRFDAGPDGAPWENQDQWVLGFGSFLTPSVKLFGEYVHVKGFAPLNFLSGGTPGLPVGTTISEHGADSDIIILGVNAAF